MLSYYNLEKTLKEIKLLLKRDNICQYATNEHTYWVILRVAEANETVEGIPVLRCLLDTNAHTILTNRYGSFLIQTFIEQENPENTLFIINCLCSNIIEYAKNEHSFKIIKTILDVSESSHKQKIIQILVKIADYILNSEHGSALLQKCLEIGSKDDFKAISNLVYSNPVAYATSEHGSLVILKIFSNCIREEREIILGRLLEKKIGGNEIINNLNGSILIQKCIDAGPDSDLLLIVECIITLDLVACATNEHTYGLIVKLFDECKNIQKSLILDILLKQGTKVICDQYGSFLIEKYLDLSNESDKEKIINVVRGENLINCASHEFGQFVVRKLIDSCHQISFLDEILNHFDNEYVCETLEFLLNRSRTYTIRTNLILSKLAQNILSLKSNLLVKTICLSTKETMDIIENELTRIISNQKYEYLDILIENIPNLISTQNGSYIFQKLLDLLPNDGEKLFESVRLNINHVSNEYAYWVILKTFDKMTRPHRYSLLESLIKNMIGKFNDEKATTLLQIYIELGSQEERSLIVDFVKKNVVEFISNQHGYYLIKRIDKNFNDHDILRQVLEKSTEIFITVHGSMLTLKWSNKETELEITNCLIRNLEKYVENEHSFKLVSKHIGKCGSILLKCLLQSMSILKSQRGTALVQNCLDFNNNEDIKMIEDCLKKNAKELATNQHSVWIIKKVYEKKRDVSLLENLLSDINILINENASRMFQNFLEIDDEIVYKLGNIVSQHFLKLASNEHGFWLLRKLFDKLKDWESVFEEKILENFLDLVDSRYGCYLVEYYLENITSLINRTKIVSLVLEQILFFVTKNLQYKVKIIIECIKFNANRFLETICVPLKSDKNLLVHQMARDQHGYWVVQYMLDNFDRELRSILIVNILKNRKFLKSNKYGRAVLFKIKRMSITNDKMSKNIEYRRKKSFTRETSNEDDLKCADFDLDLDESFLSKRAKKRASKKNKKLYRKLNLRLFKCQVKDVY